MAKILQHLEHPEDPTPDHIYTLSFTDKTEVELFKTHLLNRHPVMAGILNDSSKTITSVQINCNVRVVDKK